MIYGVYSIHDKLVGYAMPFIMPSDAVAIRAFKDSCESDVAIRNNPVDYSLCRIGSFDDKIGEVAGQEPTPIARGTDFVRKEFDDNEIRD